ncbi:hypothetical protein [Gordonia sp. MMO-8]|uniref:hypothetical protein n=1 Tax=Gordonia sp. MMO-8 TaxID=3127886 RepID=UPI0030164567
MTNQEWVREHTNGASLRALGERLNLNHVTVSRRIIEGDANTCIALARAYGQDPVEWLAGWGILTADEVAAGTVAEALRSATDLQLAEQLVARIKAGDASPIVNDPIDNVVRLGRPQVSDVPDMLRGAANMSDEKGAPDTTSEAEASQVDPNEDGFDPA